MFASCSDGSNDIPTPEEKASITIDSSIITNGLTFEAAGGEKTVSFSVNKAWTLTVAATTGGSSWCTASATSGGEGDATVKFTVKEYSGYDDRSVSVTIKAEDISKTFTITQKAIDAMLLTSSKFDVSQEGGTIEVEVKANINYQLEVAETAKSWITPTSTRALTTRKHSFAIAASEEYEKREGEIYIKSGNKVETVKVYQAGGAILMLSKNECSVSDKGETITVDIRSNMEYGVQLPEVDWIHDMASTRGASSHTLQYVIDANEGYDSRSAEIIFYDKKSNLKDTLKVIQAQRDAIIISKKEFNVKSEGETIEVKLSANVEVDITIPDTDWISEVKTRGLTESTLYFKVAKNSSFESRVAEITITDKSSNLSERIRVTQQSAPLLQLTKNEYTVSDAGETITVELKSNVKYGFDLQHVDWIALKALSSEASVETLTFSVAPNDTYNSRSAEIVFYDKNSDLKDTLKIAQSQNNGIVIGKSDYSMSAEGGAIDIEVGSNVEFTIETSVDWIKQAAATRGLESKQLHFTVEKNSSIEKREGTITFIYKEIKQVVTVSQDGIMPYVTFTADAAQTLTMSKAVYSLEYSVNGGDWNWLGTTTVTFGGNYGTLYLRGKSATGTANSNEDYAQILFGNDTPVACSGDIRTLVDYESYDNLDTSIAKFCYLFSGCSNLTTAPNLPATTLAEYCYYYMFKDCTSLTTAPKLPATTLAEGCYVHMFNGCTSLTAAPELPATTLAESCYAHMFNGCTSLTAAPELPATTLAGGCYTQMFYGCTSLTTAPELPATTLAGGCYTQMFEGCTSLTTAPELPATTLVDGCYLGMFYGCTSLTTAPELPATTLAESCYRSMFSGCTSLTTAPELPATTLAEYCYYSMFSGCTSLTTAPELPATTLVKYCYESMFGGCRSLTSAPKLPATTLAEYCYFYMFKDCTSLTAAPELPATTLVDGCYRAMFYGCTSLTTAPTLPATILEYRCYSLMFHSCSSLNKVTMLATDFSEYQCLSNWLYGVSSTGTFIKAAETNNLGGGASGIPTGWTVKNYGE